MAVVIRKVKTMKCVIKRRLKFEDYKNVYKLIKLYQDRIKGDAHNVFTEGVNKISLSFNDNKRLHLFNKVKPNAYKSMRRRIVTF